MTGSAEYGVPPLNPAREGNADDQVHCASQESTNEGEYPSTLGLVPGRGDDVVVAAEPSSRSVAGASDAGWQWGLCRHRHRTAGCFNEVPRRTL